MIDYISLAYTLVVLAITLYVVYSFTVCRRDKTQLTTPRLMVCSLAQVLFMVHAILGSQTPALTDRMGLYVFNLALLCLSFMLFTYLQAVK